GPAPLAIGRRRTPMGSIGVLTSTCRRRERRGQDLAPAVRMSLLTRLHRSGADSTHTHAVRATTASWHCRTTAIGTADTHARWTPRNQPFSHGLDPKRPSRWRWVHAKPSRAGYHSGSL